MKTLLAYPILCIILLLSSIDLYGQNLKCPPNIDFEDGDLKNWEFFIGSCCPVSTGTITLPLLDRHRITSGSGLDPYGQFPIVAPGGGQYSIKLGNNTSGGHAEKARYYVRVPAGTNSIYTLLYRYAVVFQDPGHSPSMQPAFSVSVFDSASGDPIPCNQFKFIASPNLPGFKVSAIDTTVYYKDWSTSSIDLSGLGGTTIAVDFTTNDCGLGAHFGYGYFDVECGFYQTQTLYCSNKPTITLTAPPGFKNYTWYDPVTSITLGTTKDITIPTPGNTKTFAVILNPYVGFGCPDTLFTQFSIGDMVVNTSNDTTICIGDSVTIKATTNSTSRPLTYQWSPSARLSCTNCEQPKAFPTTSTMYYATITDINGCTRSDSMFVNVDYKATADIHHPQDSFCTYDQIMFTNIGTNLTNAQHIWDVNASNGNILDGQGSKAIRSKWQEEGAKSIWLKVVNGACVETDSTSIYIKRTPNADFSIKDDACINERVTLRPTEDSAIYTWEIDEQEIKDKKYKTSYSLLWNKLGTKKVKLTLDQGNGCITTHEDDIGIWPYPVAAINNTDLSDICYGKEFTLSTNEEKRHSYYWSPPQFFKSNGSAIAKGIAEKTGYLHLNVTNQWKCTSIDSVFISAEPCCEIFMPGAFSPNNDGINDEYFSPDANKHNLLKFIIVHRRGNVVFSTTNINDKWDGTYNGEPLDMGSYAYYVEYICEGKKRMKKGTFHLIR